ncbi:hypothetical protein BX600DRAFT_473241 [Xylariales sp. PMI_506]|nr:hypothetical protein BX600DRAFT_473241 [Xylariales sp. PMI_506]
MQVPPPEVAEIIRRKKMTYGRYVDTKQLHRMSEVILPEAKMHFINPDGKPLQVGPQKLIFGALSEYTTYITKATAGGMSTHNFGAGELEQVGPDEVKAIFSMEDVTLVKGTAGLVWSRGGGYYYETWTRKGDDWFMAELRLERLWVQSSVLFIVISGLVDFLGMLGYSVF